MKNSQLAHEWANQSNASGRASHFFYEGTTLYSYGYHFKVGVIHPDGVILITSCGYSSTTARHVAYARQAVTTYFEVPGVDAESKAEHAENAKYLLEVIDTQITQAVNSRLHFDRLARRATVSARSFVDYCNTFKVKGTLGRKAREIIALLEGDGLFSFDEINRRKASIKAERARLAKKQAKAIKETSAKLDKWRAGDAYRGYDFRKLPCALRIFGDVVQTSHGANVPLEDAKQLFKLWGRLRRSSNIAEASSPMQGFSVGNFRVNGFAREFLEIGCHRIPFGEAERIFTPSV